MKKKRPFSSNASSTTITHEEAPPPAPFKAPPAPARPSWAPPAHEQAKAHLDSLADRALGLSSKTIEDRVGLGRAYAAPDSIYVRGNTAYVAGTQIGRMRSGEAFRDMYDDLKIPLFQTQNTYRYEQLQTALKAHPEVTNLVGHSLGASVALEMSKQRPELTATTYGAPVMDVFAKGSQSVPNRFANYGDPIAMFDTNATPALNLGNPHSFGNFTRASATDSRPGYANPDGSVTLYE
jgi:pimeloyl-ACP methyl ester carboxylesterase